MDLEARHLAAAQAVHRGDPLAALNLLSTDSSAHARALRGIALAQLGELERAEAELRAAALAFEGQALYRARALAALAEVAAARRELGSALESLAEVAEELEALGDERNGSWARLVRVRLLLLVGATEEAHGDLERAARGAGQDSILQAAYGLALATSSARSLSMEPASRAIDEALAVLSREEQPLLAAELESFRDALSAPLVTASCGNQRVSLALPELARLVRGGAPQMADLDDLSRWTHWFVIDAIARRALFSGENPVDLVGREVLFRLLEELGEAWPDAVSSDELVERVFEGPAGEESHRDRCRVELGRLRKLLPAGASIEALGNAWKLRVPVGSGVLRVELLADTSTLEVLLADGQAWATRDLALAIGASPRSVQRALARLCDSGEVQSKGQARARRWVDPQAAREPGGIASQMFLVSLLDPRNPGASSNPQETSND